MINTVKGYLISLKREILSYLNNYFQPRPKDQTRVVIFAQGRTGSTLLESLLSSTGHFYKNGELLKVKHNEISFPLNYIKGLSKWKSENNFLFHVKIYQLTRDRKKPIDPSIFIESLYKDGFKIIYLKRKNIIKHYLSNLVAEQKGEFHKFDDNKENIKLLVDCDNLVMKVKERIKFGEEELNVLTNIKYLEISYEDDLENQLSHKNTVDKILNYLSLEKKEVNTKHRKVNNSTIKELITNYDDFSDCLTRNGWGNYIDR